MFCSCRRAAGRCHFPIFAAALLIALSGVSMQPVQAEIWIFDGNGNWNDSNRWGGGTIASGIGALANFSTVDITGNRIVTLNTTSRTVGKLLFSDPTPTHTWSVTSTGSALLTLQTTGGSPEIEVANQQATFNSENLLLGNQGFTKTGTGVLQLNINGPTMTGGIRVNAGTLISAAGSSGAIHNSFGNNELVIGANGSLQAQTSTGSAIINLREISGSGKLVSSVTNSAANMNYNIYSLKDATFSGSSNVADLSTAVFTLNTIGPKSWTLTGSFSSAVRNGQVNNGELVLGGNAVFDRNDTINGILFTGITTRSFGTFTIDNSAVNLADRYRNAASLSLAGGTFRYIGNAAESSLETFNSISSTNGTASNFEVVRNGQDVTITLESSAGNAGNVNFTTNGTLGGNVKILNTNGEPAAREGAIVRNYFTNSDFLRYDNTNGYVAFNGYANPSSIDSATLTSSSIVLVDANMSDKTLDAIKTIAALKIVGGETLDLNASTLTIGGSGSNNSLMLLKSGTGTSLITGGKLSNQGSAARYQVRVDQGVLQIDSQINLVSNVSFIKSGSGVLVLNPAALENHDQNDQWILAEGVVRVNPNAAGVQGPRFTFAGGVMEITGINFYTPTIGTGMSNISLSQGGGFAAFGASDVTMGTSITWGATNSIGDGKTLVLNSTTANRAIILSGGINLAGASTELQFREIRVLDNGGSTEDRAVISGSISGTSNQSHLLKTGAGLLEITGTNNTYQGETVVREGRLNVNGILSGVSAPAHATVTVMSSGTLGGTGIIFRPVVVEAGGILAPGNSPGVLEIENSFQLQAGATLQIELGGTTLDINSLEEYDRLKVAGTATIAGNLAISLVNGHTLAGGQIYGILGAGAISGTFAGMAQDQIVFSSGGVDLRISYFGSFGDFVSPTTTGGNDIVLYASSVPEPSTWAMLLLGAAGLVMLKRKYGSFANT